MVNLDELSGYDFNILRAGKLSDFLSGARFLLNNINSFISARTPF